MLLIRVAEIVTGDTWRNLCHEPDPLHLVTLAIPDGQVAQRYALPPVHKTILGALQLPETPVLRHHPYQLTRRSQPA